MRYAFMLAYDGSRYFGFVRQPDRPTVEGELLRAFRRCGLYSDLRKTNYRVAARTDRGVSAMGQVVALDLMGAPELGELNAALPRDIAVLSIARVRPEFNPRTDSTSKHYRYVCEMPPGFDLRGTQRAAKLFEDEHDFRHFCKREPGKPTRGKFQYVGLTGGKFLTFDFVARAFLRQQVRRVVQALLDLGTGKLDMGELGSMLEGRADHSMRPAPPDGLFLVGVRYPRMRFDHDASAVKRFVEYLREFNSPARCTMARMLLHKGF